MSDTSCKHCDNSGVITMLVRGKVHEIYCVYCADEDDDDGVDYNDPRVAEAMGEFVGY